MINVKIIMADYDGRRGHWRIGQEVDDGSGKPPQRQLHVIPARAFVNHPAEYGLDPYDSRPVLDWLLHGRFAASPDPLGTGVDPTDPYRNPPEAAWAAHQALISETKTRVSITDPGALLEAVHRAHSPSEAQIAQARERAQQTRSHVAHMDRLGYANG